MLNLSKSTDLLLDPKSTDLLLDPTLPQLFQDNIQKQKNPSKN
jgi:hypothetical protein